MTRPVRVLSLYEAFFAGGARVLHTDLISGLHARGAQQHSVLSIASEAHREPTRQPMAADPRYQHLLRAGIGVTTLGRSAGAEPPGRHTFTDRELLVASAAVRQADVILSLKEQPLGLLLALSERGLLPPVPVATCLHRSDPIHSGPALSWLVEATALGIVDATISCAISTDDAYARAGVDAIDRYIIANGIDTDRFRPGTPDEVGATKASLGIPASAPVVVFAARFDAMKNPGLFLRAVAEHRANRPDAHYVLCGAGMDWANPAFRELADEGGVGEADSIHALGIRDDMPAIFQIADIVALTSAFGEASPLCLLEGAACGATPITTDVGDAAHQVSGFGLVTSHRPHEIAAAWDVALGNRQTGRSASLAARDGVGRDRMVADYAGAINRLLSIEEAAA